MTGSESPNAQTTGGGTVTLTDTSVTTTGVGAHGVQTANSGVTNFYGGSISTGGGGAVALLSQSGAAVTVGLDTASAATQISTSAASTAAVVSNTGGAINLTGANVTTTGAGSAGLAVNDAGSSLTATNVTVTTKGGQDPVTEHVTHRVVDRLEPVEVEQHDRHAPRCAGMGCCGTGPADQVGGAVGQPGEGVTGPRRRRVPEACRCVRSRARKVGTTEEDGHRTLPTLPEHHEAAVRPHPVPVAVT